MHDQNAIGEIHNLVQLERNQQHRLARVALSDQLPVNILNRAHVQSARGLHRHDERHIPIQLARHDGLLLIAARHTAHDGVRALSGAHVVLLDQLLGVFAHRAEADKAVIFKALFLIALEHHVLRQRVIEDQSVLVTILGDVAHARGAAGAHGGMGNIVPA